MGGGSTSQEGGARGSRLPPDRSGGGERLKTACRTRMGCEEKWRKSSRVQRRRGWKRAMVDGGAIWGCGVAQGADVEDREEVEHGGKGSHEAKFHSGGTVNLPTPSWGEGGGGCGHHMWWWCGVAHHRWWAAVPCCTIRLMFHSFHPPCSGFTISTSTTSPSRVALDCASARNDSSV
jgi:hypothetical protein